MLFQSARARNSLTWVEIYWQSGLYTSQSERGLLTVVKAKGLLFRNLFIDLIAFTVQYVPIGTGAVRSVFPAGFGSSFRIMVGSG